MKDKRIFWRFFRWTLLIFLTLWAVMAGIMVYNNYVWRSSDIESELVQIEQSLGKSFEERPAYDINLDIACYELNAYRGQIALRSYDKWGNVTNRSQLLQGEFLPYSDDGNGYAESGFVRILFDEVLTEAEELELVHRLEDVRRDKDSDYTESLLYLDFWGQADEGYLEVAGVQVDNRMFPLRLIIHQGEETITLLDLEPERYQNRPVTTLESPYMVFYGGLMAGLPASDTPEERLEMFRKLEANLDTLEERNRDHFRVYGTNSMSMLPKGMTRCYHHFNYSLALSYQVTPFYIFYGLEWVLALTFLLVLALAVFTAHVQARSVRRERAFTRAAAHELKTPLAVLRTHAEALKEDISPEKRGAYLDVILDESDRMSTLVGHLLDLSRLEAGAELRREPLDLAALTAEVLARLEPAAQVGAIALVLDLVPVQVEGDRRRLEELLAELGTNALKHCPPGGEVRVVLRLEGNRARLSVENDGPAIPAEDLPHLWEPFYKGDKSRSREGGGSGLGLALVKGAAEAHKGTCRAENRSGGGVRFTIELPALHSRT